jgi:LAO/AO transport system kinase
VTSAVAGDRGAVARLISLVERGGDGARTVARLTFDRAGHAYTVGVTGAPGAGKSTLVDRLVARARADGVTVGVLAVDPTSPFSGGALLGDRVRMQDHALDSGVFIRSMATRGHTGGLAQAVPEAVRVLDAAGMELVVLETVGVGQVEVEVAGASDTCIVVVTPGTGDSVQANKAGLLEVADVFVLNKADRPGVREARRDLETMLELSTPRPWRPPIVETVAETGQGIEQLWEALASHRRFLEQDGELERRRAARLADEVRRIVERRLRAMLDEELSGLDLAGATGEVVSRRLDPYTAADQVLAALVGKRSS